MLGSAVITIILTPFVFTIVSRICVMRKSTAHIIIEDEEKGSTALKALVNHVVLCGYGRVGINVARFLEHLNIPYVVVELNPVAISTLRDNMVPCVYGDIGNPNVLSEARIKQASILVLAIEDPVVIRLALDHAQRINSKLDIIARAHNDTELEFLESKGVSEVVSPETEAGIELARHILYRLGISPVTVDEIIGKQRGSHRMGK